MLSYKNDNGTSYTDSVSNMAVAYYYTGAQKKIWFNISITLLRMSLSVIFNKPHLKLNGHKTGF